MAPPDPADFRRSLSRFATGVVVIAAADQDGDIVGMTANSFTAVSLSPPTVLISVKQGRTLQAIDASGAFGISVLPASARDLSGHFAGRPVPGLKPVFDDTAGSPRLTRAIAYFDCRLERSVLVADHTLLIGAVRRCCHTDADPLVFFSSRYHDLGTAAHGTRTPESEAKDSQTQSAAAGAR